MNSYNSQQTKDFSFFSKNVYLDKKFLLLTPECPLTAEMKNLLGRWDFQFIYSEGEASEYTTAGTKKNAGVADLEEIEAIAEEIKTKKTKTTEISNKLKEEQDKKLMETEETFLDFLKFIEKIFTTFSVKKTIDARIVADKAKELCDFVKTNKKLILRIDMQKHNNPTNYLLMHSLRSAIFSIIIGLHIKMPPHKLIELATACIIHEIGMLKLPPQVYLSNEPLTENGRKAIFAQPILSYNILKGESFPLAICVGVLEQHERENGQGYPRNLTKGKISLYGKIIAVACSYEAATAPRPYKEAKDASEGIINMLKNENGQYDEMILKALLFSLSFYPIGTFVHLSNGKVAQVIDVGHDDPRFPIVQIYGELGPSGAPKIVGTEANGVKVTRPLKKEELRSMLRNEL